MSALITVKDVAKIFNISTETVRRRIADGTYKAVRIGRQYRLNSAQFDSIFQEAGLKKLKKQLRDPVEDLM